MAALSTEDHLKWARDELFTARRAAAAFARDDMFNTGHRTFGASRFGLDFLLELMRKAKPVGAGLLLRVILVIMKCRPGGSIIGRPRFITGQHVIRFHDLFEF